MKSVDNENWVVETKYDGYRQTAQFCTDYVRFTGAHVSVISGGFVEKTAHLPHLNHKVPYLEGTVLDGEIICAEPDSRSNDVTRIMGSLPDVAVAKQQENGWLFYVAFDCLFYRGKDLRQYRLEERRKALDKAFSEWRLSAYSRVEAVSADSHVIIVDQNPVADADELFELIVKNGGEGLIYKDLRAKYGDERSWVKRKKEATYDVVIMGYSRGKGKYEGQVGALQFGQFKDGHLSHCGQCSGMTDAQRAAISREPQNYLGKVMEIKAYARESSGKFRHPQFVRMRPDKSIKECRFNKEEK